MEIIAPHFTLGFFFFLKRPHEAQAYFELDIAKDDFELLILLPLPPSTGIIGVHSHLDLCNVRHGAGGFTNAR